MRKYQPLVFWIVCVPAILYLALGIIGDPSADLVFYASVVSAICSVGGSLLLFARKTGFSITLGIIILLANGTVTFFLWLYAGLKAAHVH